MTQLETLLNTYPEEVWIGDDDGYCAVCNTGAPCRSAIETDMLDVLRESKIGVTHKSMTICLQWLHDNDLSSLKESVSFLSEEFLKYYANEEE